MVRIDSRFRGNDIEGSWNDKEIIGIAKRNDGIAASLRSSQ